jgi:hypothetical protein
MTFEFRYNRCRTTMTEMFVCGAFWLAGIYLSILLLNAVGIPTDGLKEVAPFWRGHNSLWFGMIILTPCAVMAFLTFPAVKLWRFMMDAQGSLEIYADRAVLHLGRKDIELEKDSFTLKQERIMFGRSYAGWRVGAGFMNKRCPWLVCFIIQKGKKKWVVAESFREGWQSTTMQQRREEIRPELSLAAAMHQLEALARVKNDTHQVKKKVRPRILTIGGVKLTMSVSTPEAFEGSPFYVDYDSCTAPEGVPLCSCLVRELADPEHVAGDIGFADSESNTVPPPEQQLRKRVIEDGVALDERIGLGEK